ncbi:hypothetical protein PsorP6_016334 [Peronosclerospora sorghi]|uniref:Uncharacterized protein n=1 Tax=Peronosclerospora sorghi TaxID=230839 RepID=A0ACC0VKZ4_9STRA|nr:hypothetical protein PsorP6_016334 [Peronosclerospora sorghi]
MALQRVLEAYRAMEPTKDLFERLQHQFARDQQWARREFQVLVKATSEIVLACLYDDGTGSSDANKLEAIQAEIDDDLVTTLMDFVVTPKVLDDSIQADAMHHVSYTVPPPPSSVTVTCRVASVMNDVGLKIWEASWLLAEYIIAHPSEFHDRKVVELGAGVGFTGLVLACVCRARWLRLSDHAPAVLQNLRYNVEINAKKFKCPVDVEPLEWATWELREQDDKRPDLLLAGDCVYDIAAFPALIHALESFFGQPAHGLPERVALFAATIRNHETFQAFLDQLAVHDIASADIILSTDTQLFSYPNRDQIRLCRLSKIKCLDVSQYEDVD